MRARSSLVSLAVFAFVGCGNASSGSLIVDDTGTPSGADDAGAGADATPTNDASATPPSDASATTSSDASAATSDASATTSDGATPPAGARDWSTYPAVAQLDGVSELWVASDLHGDYSAASQLLTGAGLASISAPQSARWTGGTATLVIVGDLVDKGPDAPDVVRMLIALQSSAAGAGGHVIVTMGNHEAEFLADPNNSKATATDGFDPELTSIGLSPTVTAAGGDDIGAFVRDLPIAARVDDWFFVHAGKTDGRTLAQLAGDLQSGIDASGFGATVLSDPNSLLEAKLSKTGPQWWDATSDAATLLSQWTAALGCKHLVMGHQPGAVVFADGTSRARDAMWSAYGGLLFLVDTGASVDVDATGGALLHVKGAGGASASWEEVFPDGTRQPL